MLENKSPMLFPTARNSSPTIESVLSVMMPIVFITLTTSLAIVKMTQIEPRTLPAAKMTWYFGGQSFLEVKKTEVDTPREMTRTISDNGT